LSIHAVLSQARLAAIRYKADSTIDEIQNVEASLQGSINTTTEFLSALALKVAN
jgi:hypothetical protein